MRNVPRKILFATVPADGHFAPLTGIAMTLKAQGHDVRWYTGSVFSQKLSKLGIRHYPFERAKEVTQFNIDEIFPERKALKPGPAQLRFDIRHFFVDRTPEYFEDVRAIRAEFPFDALVCDQTFTAAELIKVKLGVKVIAVGVTPVMATSSDLPPTGLGLAPGRSIFSRVRDRLLRVLVARLLFRESTTAYNQVIAQYGLPPHTGLIFDLATSLCDAYLQSGTPGFEYPRRDLPATLKFVGPLLPYRDPTRETPTYPWLAQIGRYRRTVLVSQGTVEPDHSKLIIPTLDGLCDTDTLIIVTTGRMGTEALRQRYAHKNVVIEDFIDFDVVMPRVDVYVTNGGYGGTLLAIDHGLPMVAAGINEGKNEICARIGYFKLGISLGTERPGAMAIRKAVETITADRSYKERVMRLRNEFRAHPAADLSTRAILDLLDAGPGAGSGAGGA
jgi:UDP:flavonoid glycosyltransferase YjiC (YdhE family)